MANTEVGAAYVSVYPDTSQFTSKLSSQLNNGAVESIGRQLGSKLSSAMGSSMNGSGLIQMGNTISGAFSALAKPAVAALGSITAGIVGITAQKGWARALNIEGANRLFKGLGMSAEDTAKAMEYANNAVLDTAFGLDEAAQAAALLSTSGVALDDLPTNLSAIAGMATMAGTSMQDITDIFQVVAAQGRITGTELTRLSRRGINATAALASYMNKSQAEVKAMVSAGQVDFKTFSEAMSYAFGEAAYAANETFSGALQNTQAALGRIGQKFAQPLQESLRKLFVSAMPAINAFNASLGDTVKRFTDLTDKVLGKVAAGFDKFAEIRTLGIDEKGKTIWKDTAVTLDELHTALSAVFSPQTVKLMENAAVAIGMFAAAGPALKLMGAGVNAMAPIMGAINSISTAMKGTTMAGVLGGFKQAGSDAATMFGLHFESGIKNLKNIISGGFGTLKTDFGAIWKAILPSNSFALEMASGFTGLLSSAFKSTGLSKVTTALADSFSAMAPGIKQAASSVGNALKSGLGKAASFVSNGMVAMTGAAAGLSLGVLALGIAAVKGGVDFNALSTNITGTMTAIITNMDSVVNEISTQLPTLVTQISEMLPSLMDAITRGLVALAPVLLQLVPVLVDSINTIIQALVPAIVQLLPIILSAGMELFIGLLDALVATAPLIIEQLPTLIEGFGQVIIDNFPRILSAALQLFVAIVKGLIQVAPDVIAALWNLLTQLPGKVLDFVGEMFSAGVDLIGGLIDGIGSAIGGVVDAIMGGIEGAIDNIKSFLGIASPSKLFRYFGNMTMAGMEEGIRDGALGLYSTMDSVMSGLTDKASMDLQAAYDVRKEAQGAAYITMNVTADSSTTLDNLINQARRARIAYGRA